MRTGTIEEKIKRIKKMLVDEFNDYLDTEIMGAVGSWETLLKNRPAQYFLMLCRFIRDDLEMRVRLKA